MNGSLLCKQVAPATPSCLLNIRHNNVYVFGDEQKTQPVWWSLENNRNIWISCIGAGTYIRDIKTETPDA